MKVCTFTLRLENTYDGENNFKYRKPRVYETIKAEMPDLIGFQEVLEDARLWLPEVLTDYTVIGCGRCENYSGEGLMLAFRKDKFDLLSFDTEWLSYLPHTTNTTYGGDQSGCPRIMQKAVLLPKDSGLPFVFCNVHLDHEGENARMLGAMQLMQSVLKSDLHFIITGDFNAEPTDAAISVIRNCNCKAVKDLTENIKTTFHDFGRLKEDCKIDYIFTDYETSELNSYTVEDLHPNGLYISDHYPVIAEFQA